MCRLHYGRPQTQLEIDLVNAHLALKTTVQSTLSKLATYPSSKVKLRVAWNANTSKETLEFLAKDADSEISQIAKERLLS